MKKGCRTNFYVDFNVFLYVIVFFSFLILSPISYAATLAGMVNDIPNGDSIRVTVMNNNKACSGICSKTFDTSGAYTVVLDYLEGDALTIYAYYEEVLNTNTEVATRVPYDLRLSICDPPTKPQTYELGTIHTTSAILQWTIEDSDYSVVSLDGGNYYESESPFHVDNLEVGTHVWRVKNCNSRCCAKEAESTFIVLNNAPSEPKFQVTDKGLEIKPGSDTDSDKTYIEYRINEGAPIKSSFFDINNMRIEARTCDGFTCSNWSSRKIMTCNNAGDFIGASSSQNNSYVAPSSDQNGPAINYSDFLSEVKDLLQVKSSKNYVNDVSCAAQVSEGVDSVREILSSKINEASSFVVNTNVPSTVKAGDPVVVDIEFKSDTSLENVTFKIISPLSFSEKNYDYIVNDENVNPRLVANSKVMNATEIPIVLQIWDYKGILYTKQYYVKSIFTMSDFEYRLQELRVQSKGIIDAITSSLVMVSVFFVCVVLFFYMRLKSRYKKEIIIEAKLQKDRDLALLMLSGKQGVDAVKKDAADIIDTSKTSNINVDDLKKDLPLEKTDYEKKVDDIEKGRESYLQKNDDRSNTYFEGK